MIVNAARLIGIDLTAGELSGTIDEQRLLAALDELTERDVDNADLYQAAARRVGEARSAGTEQLDPGSDFGRVSDEATTTQLRYRAEMAEVLTDLAIDVGIRNQAEPALTT